MAGYSIGKNWELEETKKSKHQQAVKSSSKFFVRDIGIYLMTPLLLGVILGVFLDKKFNTKPIWTIVLILFGAVASFYNLWRIYRTNGKA